MRRCTSFRVHGSWAASSPRWSCSSFCELGDRSSAVDRVAGSCREHRRRGSRLLPAVLAAGHTAVAGGSPAAAVPTIIGSRWSTSHPTRSPSDSSGSRPKGLPRFGVVVAGRIHADIARLEGEAVVVETSTGLRRGRGCRRGAPAVQSPSAGVSDAYFVPSWGDAAESHPSTEPEPVEVVELSKFKGRRSSCLARLKARDVQCSPGFLRR